ncbi:hypothetical protein FHT32_005943 [Variovorax sp. SG517]|uniref:hypothetical protein n=1 Tax=Variovorax sp. SG517 TaxID=2587117 RepID=UPI00159E57D4|nr:hypothetical protein [Variovorax sp. SG517]NVM92257.1 hypothetical protein [Variovorax sp. SG517]
MTDDPAMWLAVQSIRCLWTKAGRDAEQGRLRNQAPMRLPLTGLEAQLLQPPVAGGVLWQEISLRPDGGAFENQPVALAAWKSWNAQQLREQGYEWHEHRGGMAIGWWHGDAVRHTGQPQPLGVLRPGQWLRVVTHRRANGWDYWAWERRVTNLMCVDRTHALDVFASTPPVRVLDEEPHLY